MSIAALPNVQVADRGTWKGAGAGAGAGLVAGAAVGSVGLGLLLREGGAGFAVGAGAGAAGGFVGGALTGAFGPIAGAVASIGIPVAGFALAARAGSGGGGMLALFAFMGGVPFGIGGLAGTAAGAALVKPQG